MTAAFCPRCNGNDIDCPVCGLPPKRSKPYDRRLAARPQGLLYISYNLTLAPTAVWAVQGVDLSAWNGTMHFDILRQKAQFAIVRLGYGSRWKDNRCDEYRKGLIEADIPYGVYWFGDPGLADPDEAAESFAEVAAEYPYQLDAWDDIERTKISPAGTSDWIIAMDRRMRTLIKSLTGAYSSAGFWNDNVAPDPYFEDLLKWAANWTDGDRPWLPNGWDDYDFWQWSADGNRKGIEYGSSPDGDADMDLNRYCGSIDQFNLHYGTHIKPIGDQPPLPPPDQLPAFDPGDYKQIKVNSRLGLRLRADPSLQGKIIALLPNGTIMRSVGVIDDWAGVIFFVHKDYIDLL